MGIKDIHLLINTDTEVSIVPRAVMQEALQAQLVRDHRRGKHPWGLKRRQCPLCQKGD